MHALTNLSRLSVIAAFAAALGLAAGLMPEPTAAEGDQMAAVQVVRPWVAPTRAGDVKVQAVIGNDEDVPVALMGAKTGAASDVMLIHKGQPVDRVVIHPHDAVGPHGFYLLLNDLNRPLADGDSIEVILQFQDRAPMPVQVVVGEEAEAG
ncbi:copper chaperone PCu(A)C [Caenispirillum salinarum]|uniref:copper chaperone PCu(A)C n=1 Tax=Caenispirillum salinarum TaxID=859058 RepID=UPI00384EFB3B